MAIDRIRQTIPQSNMGLCPFWKTCFLLDTMVHHVSVIDRKPGPPGTYHCIVHRVHVRSNVLIIVERVGLTTAVRAILDPARQLASDWDRETGNGVFFCC